jgi:predicted lysophospholipase L1 biosynthesis ABC-type transport system permease subunit
MAFEPGRGRTAVPVRSAFVGAALGALGVVAVLTFAASLHALVTTPARYGWDWDLWVEDDPEARSAALVCGNVETQLARTPSLDAVTAVCELGVEVDGLPVAGYGFVPVRGAIGATVVEGRGPTGPDEVALGRSTLEALGKRIGDTVEASGEAGPSPYRVVGTVVLPAKGATFEPQPLAEGAVFTGAGLEALDAPGGDGYTDFVVRLASGVDPATAASRVAELPGLTVLDRRPALPVEVDRVRQVDWLPMVLAAFMGVLAAVAVGHALVTAVRRRRLDLAVLKTLGFSRRQVRATVAGQATALSGVGLLVGVPLGLVAGRAVWRLVAEGLGVAPSATFPVPAVLAVGAGGIVLPTVIAAPPGRIAARTQPAVVLRSE